MRKISMLMIATVFLLLSSIHAQTALNPGDLVIVTANADGSDNFDFIPLVDIQVGTVIKFTDNAWTTADTLRTNEGTVTWTASANVAKGTVVSYTGATAGDWVKGTGFDIAAAGDNILVYQGDATTPSFIYGIGWAKANNWIWTGNNDSDIPDALSVASKTIVQLANFDDNQYNGSTSGTIAQLLAMVAYAPYWVGNDATAYTAYPNAFTITATATCTAPYALTATGITSSSANLGWSTFGTEVLWNVEYGVTGFVQGAGTTVSGVTNPYTLNGLTQNTTYQFYVQADCGGSTSTWAGPFSFTTPYSCPKPTLTTVANITATSAVLGWTNGGTETAWIVYYKTDVATDYTEVTGVTTNPYTLGGLTANTNYIFKVKANCSVSDTSFVSVTKTFTTPYSCPKPTLTTVANITATSAVLGWTNGGTETAWIVYYKTDVATDYTEVTGVTTNPYTLGGLTANTNYIFKVKANCSVSDTSFVSETKTFSTIQVPASIPYTEGFETWSNNWTVVNGTQVNKWAVGTAVANTGIQSAYVSIDNGTTNAYTTTSTSCVHMYRDITFPAGVNPFNLKFNWKGQGEGTTTKYDYLRVFLVPITTTPVSGTELTGQLGTYNLQSTWQTENLTLANATYANQTWRLVVSWKNDGSSGTQPPIAIDDIAITELSCVPPTALAATSITAAGATLGWTAGGTETLWNVEYGVTGFVQGAGTTVTGVTNPYTLSGLTQNTTYQYYVKSDCGGSGTSTWAGPFSFTTPYSCPKPTLPTAENITTSSAQLGWTNGGTETAWIVYYKTAAATDYTEVTGVTTNPYTLNGLTAATSYIFKVKANCSVSDTSFTSTTQTFATTCNIVSTFPYIQNFNDVTLPALPICFSQNDVNADNDKWITYDTYGVAGSKCAGLYTDYNAGANNDLLILPQMTLTGNERLKFSVRSRTTGEPNDYSVVLSTTDNNPASFTTTLQPLTAVNSATMTEILPISLSAYTGNVWIAIKVPTGGLDGYYLYVDDITVETIPSCLTPTALTATSITATGANLGWTAGGTETLWNVEYGVTGFVQGAGTTVTGVTNPYTLSGLTQNTTYQYYVKSDCGGSGTSTWAGPFSFTTPYSCPKPTLPTATNITTTSAQLGWTNGGTETAWIVYYKTAAATDYTEVTGVTTNPYTLNGLTAATSYIFKVKANCSVTDTSFVSATKTFTTPCNAEVAPTLVQDFATYTGNAPQPICWSEATGVLGATTTLTYANSEWNSSTGFANSGTNVGVKTNLYSTGNEWLISQPIDLGATAGLYRVSYKYAVTSYNATVSQATLGTHKVNVVVSTDGGATWSNTNSIKEYTGAASYSNTGVTETINLTGYSGIVKIAFVATTTALSPDIDFHIDDFKVEAIPSCLAPTALNATSITPTGATLGWTAGGTETLWNVEYGVTGFTQGTGTSAPTSSNSLALTSLSAATTYQFFVQANCGGSGTSTWAGPFSFTTACNAVSTFPWSESFDGTTFAPTCWLNTQTAGTGTTNIWDRSTAGTYPTATPHSGAGMARYNCFNISAGIAAQLVTPALNLPTDLYEVKFWMYRDNGYLTNLDLVNVYYNTTPNTTGATLLGTVNRNNTLAPVEATANQWYQYKFNMPAGSAGTNRYIVIEAVSAYGNNIFIDDIQVDVIPACVAPTALNATSITASGATLGWTAGGTETLWNVEYGVTGFVQGAGTTVTGVANPKTLTGLTQNTTYQFYVQSDCGGSGTSTWSGPVSFTTAYSCPKPTLPTVSNITAASADLAWTAGGTETSWIVYYKTAAATNFTEVLNVTSNPYTLSGLTSGTSYIFKVKANCSVSDTSVMSNTQTFATTCVAITALPYTVPFTTYLPSVCWLEGDAGDLTAGPTTISATAADWVADGFLNNGSTGAAKINVYGTSLNDWLISPEITIPAGSYRLKYSVGATQYADVIAPTTPWESDDVVQVLVSTTHPANWTVLKTYNNTNVPSHLGQDDMVDLAAYASQTIRIAYRALMGSTNSYSDIDFFVDNFTVEAVPSCEAPLSLSATAITTNSANIAFTSAAPNFKVRYRLVGASTWSMTTATASPASITGLTHSSNYEAQIMAFCTATDSSAWSSVVNFTTLCGVYAVPYLQDFNVAPNCWTLSSDTLNSSIDLSGTSSYWGLDNYLNISGGQLAARLNIYGSSRNSWLLSPEINLGTGANQLEFDLGATAYAATTAPTGTCADDKFAVVISTDGGITWSQANTLRLWDNAGSTNVYNNITNTSQHVTIDLSTYTGIVKIAFYGESFVSDNGDNDLFVDNVAVNPILPPCATPTALVVTNIAQTTANLGWTSTAANFNVRYRIVGGTTWTVATAATTTLSLTSLTANTQYEFQVQAVCSTFASDTSNWATIANFTTLAVPSCATPTALAVTNIAQTTANLGWTSTAANFNVRYRTVGATTWTAATAATTTLSLTSLTANTQYEFQVQAVCSATAGDTSAWATAVNFTTLATPACATPTALAATNIAQTTADLGWTSTAANFNIRYRIVSGTTWTPATAATTTLSLTSLTANTQYEFQVQAICSTTAGDTSAWATIVNFTTLATCNAPTALVVTAINASGASLNWTAGGTETAWNLRYKRVADATYINVTNTTIKPYILTALQSSTAYVWNVQAVCSSSLTSPWSVDNTFNTTVGISNNSLSGLNVYSVNNQINVINNDNLLVKEVVVYDVIGKEVAKYAINSTDNVLINTNFSVANYIVKVVTDTQVGTYKLLIK